MKKLLFLICLIIPHLVSAQIPKPAKNTYVNDYAGVLTKDQITALNQKIYRIEKGASAQLAIVLVDRIPADYDIQDFAVLIGKKWHVGKNKKGIVYVAAIQQHKQRLEVARNLEDIFPGATAIEILNAIKPSFKSKDYNAGLELLVSQITDKLQVNATQQSAGALATNKPVQAVDNQQTQPGTTQKSDDTQNAWVGFIAIVLLVVVLVVYLNYRKRKRNAMINNMQGFGGTNAGYYNPSQGINNQAFNNAGYNNQPGYGMPGYIQPDHTLRNVVAGAALGAAAGYAARTYQDRDLLDPQNQQLGQTQGNYNTGPGNQINDSQASDNDNTPGNWGNWGGSDSSSPDDSSSYDSGFSDDSSDSSSSDSDDRSGATSDW
jgi:uncharacterized protein